MKKSIYCVKWWNAYGEPRISEPMDKQMAEAFASSMDADQEATIVLIYKNN